MMQGSGTTRKLVWGDEGGGGYMPDIAKSAAVRQAANEQLQQDLLHLSSKGPAWPQCGDGGFQCKGWEGGTGC